MSCGCGSPARAAVSGATVAQRGCGTECSCSCKKTVARGDPYDGAFLRPTFFAGQLLCEDDLEALGAYMQAKTRLHNRYLFGSGVVCGLKVVVNPKDCRKVLVSSGYALACGDDVFVPCQVEVDVIDLLQRLPANARCPDPCIKGDRNNLAPDAAASSVAANQAEAIEPEGTQYLLGIEYAEVQRDPALTYAVECGQEPACEPTRIQEGFVFSLRCPREPFTVTEEETWDTPRCSDATPPCPCEDDSFVALAEITISDCMVTDLCMSARDFVITGHGMRYWRPEYRNLERTLQVDCFEHHATQPPAPGPAGSDEKRRPTRGSGRSR